jgi:hypothetical protein
MAKRSQAHGAEYRLDQIVSRVRRYQETHPGGLSLNGMAALIGIPYSTLRRWVRVRVAPADSAAYRKAIVGLDALLAGDPIPKDSTPYRDEIDARVRYWTKKIQNESEFASQAHPEPPGRDEITKQTVPEVIWLKSQLADTAGDPIPKGEGSDSDPAEDNSHEMSPRSQEAAEATIKRLQDEMCLHYVNAKEWKRAYERLRDSRQGGWIVGTSVAIGAVIGGAVVALGVISGVLPL